MEVVFSIAQRIAVLHQGRVIADGDAGRGARGSHEVRRVYLGESRWIREMSALLERRGRPHGLRAAAGCSSASRSRSTRASACACSAATASARPPPCARIMGLTPPTARPRPLQGRATSLAGRPTASRGAGIGFVPEDRRIFAELIGVGESRRGRRAAPRPGRVDDRERVTELFPKLGELRDRQGGFLSGGEQQMLTIARTLMGNPELLLLDEPSEGLAPLVVEHLLAQVGELKAQGLTILLAEQGIEFSLALADRVYVLEKGAVRFASSSAALRSDRSVLDQLLTL